MVRPANEIDIRESKLSREGNLLDLLLVDRTTGKNIIWGTDSYEERGEKFAPDKQIVPSLITGEYDTLIQPRAAKSIEEQQKRTKEKAEVFTPLNIIQQMNSVVDQSGKFQRITKNNWKEYIQQVWLEITCGEGPFIVSRYHPTAGTGEIVSLKKRVGFLDKKLQTISKYCDNKKDWLFWTKMAFQSSYGYDWQGDNVLLARENLLYTLIDYYQDKFNEKPTKKILNEFAEIISWNIFQMDGLKHVVPMSCCHEAPLTPYNQNLFGNKLEKIEEDECEGCKYNRPNKHNGNYARIMDWKNKKIVKFCDLI